MKLSQGYPLIELVVVIVIISVLATTVIPKLIDVISVARRSDLNSTKKAVKRTDSFINRKPECIQKNSPKNSKVDARHEAIKTVYGNNQNNEKGLQNKNTGYLNFVTFYQSY